MSGQSLDPSRALGLDVGDRGLEVANLLDERVARVAGDCFLGGARLLRFHALVKCALGTDGLDAEGVRHASIQFFQS